MSLIKRWGLGVDLQFTARDAVRAIGRTHAGIARLRTEFANVGAAASGFVGSMGQLALIATPVALAFGAAIGKGSALASSFEAQSLTMRVMVGDATKAAALMETIRQKAAATPFAEGDLIEGSKRLLRLTRDNVSANTELLDVAMTMAAINPDKSVVDAVEGILDATSGGGFERLKEFGLAFRAEDFAAAGRPGGEAWAQAVTQAIGNEMRRATRGEDIVGALSQTFSGRLSTLKDAGSNILRSIGIGINDAIGPMLPELTGWIQRLEGPLVASAGRIMGVIREVAARAAPFVQRLVGLWASLGEDGQARVFDLVLGLGALLTVLLPAGGVVGGVVVALGAVLSAGAALVPLLSSIAGAVGAALAPEVLLPVAGAVAAVAGGVAVLFAAISREGEGPMDTIRRLAGALEGPLAGAMAYAGAAWDAFTSGFSERWAGLSPMIDQIRTAFEPVVLKVSELLGLLLGEDWTATIATWETFGRVIGVVADVILGVLLGAIKAIAVFADVAVSALRPFYLAIYEIARGFSDLVSGSASAADAISRMMRGLVGGIFAMANAVMQILVGTLQIMLGAMADAIRLVPGLGGVADLVDAGASGLGDVRGGIERALSESIAATSVAAGDKAAAVADAVIPPRAAASSQDPVRTRSETGGTGAAADVVVKINEREIARAVGAAGVRTAQRRGEELPADARGRVLRGAVVQPLTTSDVW